MLFRSSSIEVIVDTEVSLMKNVVVGANVLNYHLKNVNFTRDYNGTVIDCRSVEKGDLCPMCGKPLSIERGIEVGQIFKLGTKYSGPMKCTYKDNDGSDKPMVMGCYGIGVTRTMASIIEQHHDDAGIVWPINVAPYHAVIVPINYNDETMKKVADEIYSSLQKNRVEVVLDDRDAKPGFKFKDWELIGLPFIVTAGRRSAEGIVEVTIRETLEKKEMTINEAINFITTTIHNG